MCTSRIYSLARLLRKDASLHDLGIGLASGCPPARGYLHHIATINSKPCTVLQPSPDAPAIASRLDTKRALGTLRRPLHGIPILLMDKIATGDRMNTTASSYALLGTTMRLDKAMQGQRRAPR
ncbi:amidase [Apiospora hydei]|uniref:Amidase n=1 Tax=Apiospora hydei TaxID=1337664 RepID=A0ABR1V3L8_9PEZI